MHVAGRLVVSFALHAVITQQERGRREGTATVGDKTTKRARVRADTNVPYSGTHSACSIQPG